MQSPLRSHAPRRATPASLGLLALAALLVAPAATRAADPDPLQLLRDSAEAVVDAESASVDFKVSTTLVRDEMKDDMSATFRYRTAPGGRFEFVSVSADGKPPRSGYHVASNGDVMLTALLSRRQHMLEPDADGFAAFVRSPAPSGIGSGLGGLALAFLHPAAMSELVESVNDSEFVGAEEVDGEKLLHARYTVNGDVTADVWFKADGPPLVRRVSPDVMSTPGIEEMASRFEKFDFRLNFDFNDWNTDAGLTADDIQVVEPSNSRLMASLYQMPKRPPHTLLGKKAPAFELATPEGDRVDVGKADDQGVVILEFWATTCPVCIQAMPALEKLHEEYADKGVSYYAVNVGEAPEDVAAFLEARGLAPTALLDESADVATAYEVGAIPLILLIGPDQRVQVAQEGFGAGTPMKLAGMIEATLRGEDIAGAQLKELRQEEERRVAERERLRSLLDG